jgi:hypothetical protein
MPARRSGLAARETWCWTTPSPKPDCQPRLVAEEPVGGPGSAATGVRWSAVRGPGLAVDGPYLHSRHDAVSPVWEQNPARARFCSGCGMMMREAAESEECKGVSVLLCDPVGFTARSDHTDSEDVRAVLRPQDPGDPQMAGQPPAFHVHFTPTYSSWMNQVERWPPLVLDRPAVPPVPGEVGERDTPSHRHILVTGSVPPGSE